MSTLGSGTLSLPLPQAAKNSQFFTYSIHTYSSNVPAIQLPPCSISVLIVQEINNVSVLIELSHLKRILKDLRSPLPHMPTTADRECPIVLVSESVVLLGEDSSRRSGAIRMATGLKEAINIELENRAANGGGGGVGGKRPSELPSYTSDHGPHNISTGRVEPPGGGTLKSNKSIDYPTLPRTLDYSSQGRKKLSITPSDYDEYGGEGESIYRRQFYEDPQQNGNNVHGAVPPPSWNNRKYDARESLDEYIGIKDVCGNKRLWKMLMAEFIGTLFLVLIGCGSCIGGWTPKYEPSMVQIALAFGITVATMAQVSETHSFCSSRLLLLHSAR